MSSVASNALDDQHALGDAPPTAMPGSATTIAAPQRPLRLAERIARLEPHDPYPEAWYDGELAEQVMPPAVADRVADGPPPLPDILETDVVAPAAMCVVDDSAAPPDDTETRTVAAAAELVTLLAEQRTLLDAMTRLRTEPPELPAELPPIAVPVDRLPLSPPIATSGLASAGDHERPPNIITRAHADQRAGGTGFAEPYEERPSRLPGFAGGLALALATGALLYAWRLG